MCSRENKNEKGEAMGPTANPILVFGVILTFFWGMGFVCYLFGRGETKSSKSGM